MSDTAAYTSFSANKTYLDRAYALQSPTEARTLYDEWAKTYDSDLSDLEYVFHRHAAGAVLANLPGTSGLVTTAGTGTGKARVSILDAGCGTGLVGVALNEALKRSEGLEGERAKKIANVEFEIMGVDISTGMLGAAERTGLYAKLRELDLTGPLEFGSGIFDVVVCVGTLTRGHVGPKVLSEFSRVTKSDGIIVATVLEEIWEVKGFDKEVAQLAGDGGKKLVEVVSVQRVGVVKGAEVGGRLIVLRKV